MTKNQTLASDPKSSVWLSASAGTGKTRVLVNRVLRLLLSGTQPEKILCLTFTKAAAAEMSIRLNNQLGIWETMPIQKLSQSITELTGTKPNRETLVNAKNMLSIVLDSSEGIKTETIHGFCQSILRRFPIEAGISPEFKIADEQTQTELLLSAKSKILSKARSEDDQDFSNSVAIISANASELEFEKIIDEIIASRKRLEKCFLHYKSFSNIFDALSKKLQISSTDSEISLAREFSIVKYSDLNKLLKTTKIFSEGSKIEKNWAFKASLWLNCDSESRIQTAQNYARSFFTQSGTDLAYLPGKRFLNIHPDLAEIFYKEQNRAREFLEKIKSIRAFERAKAIIYLSSHMIEAYDIEKSKSGILDYNDQIHMTNNLLTDPKLALWVLYKLDGGTDHILVDEAQDVSQIQWDIIINLANEYFINTETTSTKKSIFVVGDEKQSIFSFQGADPLIMQSMQSHLSEKSKCAEFKWSEISLDLCFRSTVPIMELIHSTFNQPDILKGVTNKKKSILTQTVRKGESGLVEIWEKTQTRNKTTSNDKWSPPIHQETLEDPSAILASKIAKRISFWLTTPNPKDNEAWLFSHNRRLLPKDIMILVQQRSILVDYLVKALKTFDVPVAGVDRMVLLDQLAIMDLIAIANFVIFPKDDLNLANVLKSPFIGLSEEELFELAYDRGSVKLWDRICDLSDEKEIFSQTKEYLNNVLLKGNTLPPYEFFSELLMFYDGKSKLIRRLGEEVDDPLNEFLKLAHEFQSDHPPSLQLFLSWIQAGKTEVKRDMERDSGKVRIMTVHGAKGLEAPVVFLADATRKPAHRPKLLWLKDGVDCEVPIWPGQKVNDPKAFLKERLNNFEKQKEEYRRLLYVAMTRAEDRLYICGIEGKKESIKESWYDIIYDGFKDLKNRNGYSVGIGYTRFECPQIKDEFNENYTEKLSQKFDNVPKVKFSSVQNISHETINPSSIAYKVNDQISPLEKTRRTARDRGKIVHKLLEFMPNESKTTREKTAFRWLNSISPTIPINDQKKMVKSVLRILDNPNFAYLFDSKSVSEVSLGALIGSQYILGKIDRIIIKNDIVRIIDYKTDIEPPTDEKNISEKYLSQMAAYKIATAIALPEYSIECGLLFIENSELIWLSPEILDLYAP
tara:strand:- start:244 stop:3657 length:3414 start_codon:yes stop_codon:yes gene_type:complete